MSNEMTRQDMEQAIRIKCLKDSEYRQQLLANPKSAIEAEFGFKVPENVAIEVQEETANKLVLTIPPVLPEASNDLSEEELEAVAGGATPTLIVKATIGVTGLIPWGGR